MKWIVPPGSDIRPPPPDVAARCNELGAHFVVECGGEPGPEVLEAVQRNGHHVITYEERRGTYYMYMALTRPRNNNRIT